MVEEAWLHFWFLTYYCLLLRAVEHIWYAYAGNKGPGVQPLSRACTTSWSVYLALGPLDIALGPFSLSFFHSLHLNLLGGFTDGVHCTLPIAGWMPTSNHFELPKGSLTCIVGDFACTEGLQLSHPNLKDDTLFSCHPCKWHKGECVWAPTFTCLCQGLTPVPLALEVSVYSFWSIILQSIWKYINP